METVTLSNGKAIAQAHFDTIVAKGKKFKDRNIPIYIRKHLWTPYYLIFGQYGEQYIYIIQLPNDVDTKVHFKAHLIIEHEST